MNKINNKDLGELLAKQIKHLEDMKASFGELGVKLSKLLVLASRDGIEGGSIENPIQEVGSELERLDEKMEKMKENDDLYVRKSKEQCEELCQIEEKLESSELDEEGQVLLKKARETRKRIKKNAETTGIDLKNQLLGRTIKAAKKVHSLFVRDFIEHEQDGMNLNHVLFLAALLYQCLTAGDMDVLEEYESISKF